jgi:N-acetylglucosamine-6-phosphate deacetylase
MSTLIRGAVQGVAALDAAVLVDNGRITWVGAGPPPVSADRELVAGPGEVIAPGFIDLQVNGFNGHDAAQGADAISAISGLLPAYGVTGFLPTIISSPLREVREFVHAVQVAAAPGARVLGAHVEGPFLNPAFRGAHEKANLAEPTPDRIAEVLAAAPRMMTLAPELPGGMEAIAQLRDAGVVVAAGHTGADFEQGRKAVDAGVRFATHIYNAMPPVHHRKPGITLALLLDPRVTTGLIADGEHVHPSVCDQVLRVKGTSRIAVTTDQTSAAGSPPGRYRISGREVISDGRTVRLEDGTLAGSAATMPDLLRVMSRLPGMNASGAIRMATAVPAGVIGEKRLGRIAEGACADLVVLDLELRPRLTMIRGVVKFSRSS